MARIYYVNPASRGRARRTRRAVSRTPLRVGSLRGVRTRLNPSRPKARVVTRRRVAKKIRRNPRAMAYQPLRAKPRRKPTRKSRINPPRSKSMAKAKRKKGGMSAAKRKAAGKKAAATRKRKAAARSAAAKKAARTRKRKSGRKATARKSTKRRSTKRRKSTAKRRKSTGRRRRRKSGTTRIRRRGLTLTLKANPRRRRRRRRNPTVSYKPNPRRRRRRKARRNPARSYRRSRRRARRNPAMLKGALGQVTKSLRKAAPVGLAFFGTRFASGYLANLGFMQRLNVGGFALAKPVASAALVGLTHMASKKVKLLAKHRDSLMLGAGLNLLDSLVQTFAPESVKAMLGMSAPALVAAAAPTSDYVTLDGYVAVDGAPPIDDNITLSDYLKVGDYGLESEMGQFQAEMGMLEADLGTVEADLGSFDDRHLGGVHRNSMLRPVPSMRYLAPVPARSFTGAVPDISSGYDAMSSLYTGIFRH